MAEGQRLRWWQEEGQDQAAQGAMNRVAVTPAPLLTEARASPAAEQVTLAEDEQDTWAELEAEALRRSQQVKTEEGEEVSFYLDQAVARVRHRRELRNWALFFLACMAFSFASRISEHQVQMGHIHIEYGFIGVVSHAVVFLPFICGHFFLRRRWLRNISKPVVRLSPLGIHLRLIPFTAGPFFRSNVLIPWGDVSGIRPKSFFASRYLEIYSRKAGKVNVFEHDLPISAKDLAARIADYKAAREID